MNLPLLLLFYSENNDATYLPYDHLQAHSRPIFSCDVIKFISIISGATPLKNEPWGLANKMTSKALDAIGSIGGPRCCKRDSYMAIISAIDYVAENFNIQMEKPVIKCIHSDKNNQCIKERCPFHE